MNHRSRLQGWSGRFLSHPGRSELAQFIEHQRQQFLSRFVISLFHRLQDARDIAHVSPSIAPNPVPDKSANIVSRVLQRQQCAGSCRSPVMRTLTARVYRDAECPV